MPTLQNLNNVIMIMMTILLFLLESTTIATAFLFSNKNYKKNYISSSFLPVFAHSDRTNNPDNDYDPIFEEKFSSVQQSCMMDRRELIRTAIMAGGGAVATLSLQPAEAACLSGDTSEDCIGVYKMPIDDAVNSYVETPEVLKKFAPDIRWVPQVQPPKNYMDAYQDLNNMYMKSCDLEKWVLSGNLTKAGIDILEIVPRVTVSGKVIVSQLQQFQQIEQQQKAVDNSKSSSVVDDNNNKQEQDWSMKSYRIDVAIYELLIRLGQTDVMLGQGINGQLGALTAAQIQILQEVKDVKDSFTDLMKILPDPSDVTPAVMKQKKG